MEEEAPRGDLHERNRQKKREEEGRPPWTSDGSSPRAFSQMKVIVALWDERMTHSYSYVVPCPLDVIYKPTTTAEIRM